MLFQIRSPAVVEEVDAFVPGFGSSSRRGSSLCLLLFPSDRIAMPNSFSMVAGGQVIGIVNIITDLRS